jgi:hypothetical protein
MPRLVKTVHGVAGAGVTNPSVGADVVQALLDG